MQKGGPKTLLEAARWEAGYPGQDGLRRFARRMRRCPLYVRRIELHGRAPLVYAQQAERLLGCHRNLFMWPNWQPAPGGWQPVPSGAPRPVPEGPTLEGPPRRADREWDKTNRTEIDRTETGRTEPEGRGGARAEMNPETNPRRLLAQAAYDQAPGNRHDKGSRPRGQTTG